MPTFKPPIKNDLKILAIDPATTTGWAISRNLYGEWNLKPQRDESMGSRLIRLKAKLIEVVNVENINYIVFERPGGRFKSAIIVHAEIQATIKLFCEENKIEYRAFSSKEIKKFATDNGNANKEAMVKAAKKKLGYVGTSDNEADALWMLELAKSLLQC